jgi:hypothetical protein
MKTEYQRYHDRVVARMTEIATVLVCFGLAVSVCFIAKAQSDVDQLLIEVKKLPEKPKWAGAKPERFADRCTMLGGAHARIHDAEAAVLYDEVCIFGRLPGDD